MMTKQFTKLLPAAVLLVTISCSNPASTPDCEAPAITITATTGTNCGNSDGSISATASGGQGKLTFSIDGLGFQESGTFTNLPSGIYAVTVQDESGCTASKTATIFTGISFAALIKPIIANNCAVAGCHVAGGTAPFKLTTFSEIQIRAFAIKSRTSAKTMPPPSSGRSLSDQQIQRIACWVNDGAIDN